MADRTWGLWWRGDGDEPAGWCEDAGSNGPVTRAVCVRWLATAESPRALYRIVRWSAEGPGREIVAEWWETRYATGHTATPDRWRTREQARQFARGCLGAPRVVVHVRRWRLRRG